MKTVANEIVVFESGFGGIKDLHQHDNDMGPLHQHPSEGIQKEEVQEKRYGGTGDLERFGLESYWLVNGVPQLDVRFLHGRQ
uniref:Uncharacterized protein n=1 Tax=Magallana gigas TaxID=29159 RepID=K1QKZ0_MAGGI